MSVLENAKEIGELIRKYNDIELMRRIVELEVGIAELQRDRITLEGKVAELSQELATKKAMQFRQPYFWQQGDEIPFCPKCWEGSGKAVHLSTPYQMAGGIGRRCVNCDEIFWEGGSPVRMNYRGI
jgi:hypothetical protein